jgi:hypothetical protein
MNSKTCKECGKQIEKNQNLFCNNSCAAKYNNRKRNKKKRFCLNCGRHINKYANKFCDINCYQEYQFKNKILPMFYLGKISTNDTIKKILIYLYGEKCIKCGNNGSWMGKPLTLQVDHINGNSDNNTPNNLRLLCPNCHSQTETFCGGCKPKNTKRNKYLRKYKNKLTSPLV